VARFPARNPATQEKRARATDVFNFTGPADRQPVNECLVMLKERVPKRRHDEEIISVQDSAILSE